MNVNRKDLWLFRGILITLVVALVAKIFFMVDPVNAGSKETSKETPVSTKNIVKEVDKRKILIIKGGFVNVYSSRKEQLVSDLFEDFTKSTGIKVNFITDKAGKLISRMQAEGKYSPADLFLTSDVGNLEYARSLGLLKGFKSETLSKKIPDRYKSINEDNSINWVGLTLRARALIYSKDRVKPEELSTYENLQDKKWQGKILVRSSSNIYNQSLLASIIEENGIEKADIWTKNIVDNMARKPQGGDTDQIRAVASGEGDIAIANSYYYGRLSASEREEDKEIVQKTGIYFPNQDTKLDDGTLSENYGTHVNISGGGVAASSKNADNAIKLLEFLASNKAQKIYAEKNHEFPVVEGVKESSIVSSWGNFKKSKLPLSALSKHREDVMKTFDKSGWR